MPGPLTVTVRVPAALREVTAGASSLEVEVQAGADGSATVSGLLDVLARSCPALERRVRDERGVVRPHVNLYVGEDDVRARDGLATPLADGSELTILPAVSGG